MTNESKKNNIYIFLVIFICFFPYLLPASYVLGEFISEICSLWLKFTWVIAILLTFISRKISKSSIYFILFQLSIFLASLLNIKNGDFSNSLYLCATNISIVLLIEFFIKKNIFTIKNLKYIYGFLLIINYITMFIYYPHGMYVDILNDRNYYFLEHDNGSFFYALTVLYLFIVDDLKNNKKLSISTIMFIILSFISYLYVGSVTAYICLGILILALFFRKNNVANKFVSSNLFYLIFIVIIFLLLSLNTKNVLYVNLADVLNKDITLSGRTIIWARAIKIIKNNFIFGYGNEYLSVRIMRFGISHVHNILLQILYNGGIISLTFYFLYLKNVNKSILALKNTNNELLYYSRIIIFLFLIASMFDFYNTKFIINIIFALMCNMNYIIPKKKIGEKNE